MNIWIIDHYSSEPRFSGISRQYDFANGLSAKGYNVLVIASSFSHFTKKYLTEGECTVTEINPKAHYAYVKTMAYETNDGWRRGFGSTLSFVNAVKKHRGELAEKYGKPDVVVGCSIHPFAWVAAYRAAKYFKARFFAEVRDLWPASWIDNKGLSPNHPRALFFGWLEKWAYKRAEKIIYSMSKGDKYICGKLGFPKEKTIWIDQPMFTEKFDENAKRYDELPAEIRDFIGDSFICVFTGFYKDYEGVHDMLQAANILLQKGSPIKFVFLGTGDAMDGMLAYKEEKQLKNVYIGGRISKELIPPLLRRAQICLVQLAIKGNRKSYQYDASKNKINEYMYSDSVIIYGTYQQHHNVETSGAGICIEPFDGQAFADTIEKVYNMTPKERKQYGDNARKYILENNTLERLTDKYISILEKK